MEAVEMKIYTTNSGKQIKVWDNIINHATGEFFFQYARNSAYRLGWGDGYTDEHRKYQYLHCALTNEEAASSMVLNAVGQSEIKDHLGDLSLSKAIVNLSTPSDVHFPHTHSDKFVLLYYVNPIWRAQWYGETLFWDESATNIELALPYTPRRLVLFEGSTPHSIRPQSRDCESHRFTYAMFFDKEKGEK
jgi:hypothetical protein